MRGLQIFSKSVHTLDISGQYTKGANEGATFRSNSSSFYGHMICVVYFFTQNWTRGLADGGA